MNGAHLEETENGIKAAKFLQVSLACSDTWTRSYTYMSRPELGFPLVLI